MILLALSEDADGTEIRHDDGPLVYISSDLIGRVEGCSVNSGPGSRLIDRDGKTLGYIRRSPRLLARLINGFDELHADD